jgi:hypothetical protein
LSIWKERCPYVGLILSVLKNLLEMETFIVRSSILFRFLSEPYIIFVIAGRVRTIVEIVDDVALVSVNLNLLPLDPFSENDVLYVIQETKRLSDEPILSLLFPSHPEGHSWFFKQLYDYAGGYLVMSLMFGSNWQSFVSDLSKIRIFQSKT